MKNLINSKNELKNYIPHILNLSTCLAILCFFSISSKAADLEFRAQPFEYAVKSHLVAGTTLTLWYDLARIKYCNASNRMYQSFTTMSYRFDQGEIQTTSLNGTDIRIFIPENVNSLELWFKKFTLSAQDAPPVCEVYDSNWGSNYRFIINKK